MRTAEEIIRTKKQEGEKYGGVPLFNLFDVIDAINEARDEVINEVINGLKELKSETLNPYSPMAKWIDPLTLTNLQNK